MRLIDADELMEHVYRDKLNSRELIAKMVNNAPTVQEIPTKIPMSIFEQLISQEPCEDAISRVEARHLIVETDRIGGISCGAFKTLYNGIDELSPVTPKQKMGRWILTDDNFVYCSECEDSYYPRPIDASWYYCPHCGAKMAESEDT